MTAATNQLIQVTVSPHDNHGVVATVAVRCQSRSDGIMAHDVDVEGATGQRFSPAIAQILKSETVAGLLTGRHKATGGWTLSVEHIAGSEDGESALLQIPSVGYAVAATLAVLHGTGVENLQQSPHGGHGWDLIALEIQPESV
jgi:hypothetical protein